MTPAAAIAALQQKLGYQAVQTDPAVLYQKSFDATRISRLPSAVITPAQLTDIAVVLELANVAKLPITVRGGGTSLTGGAVPAVNGWVLDLSAFQGIKIDAVTGVATVEPGATIAAIQTAAAAQGWMYPPDPASRMYATIGGAIATNASGMTGVKYGATWDYVLGLKGYLPTGEDVQWG